jgi:hypothetical protein
MEGEVKRHLSRRRLDCGLTSGVVPRAEQCPALWRRLQSWDDPDGIAVRSSPLSVIPGDTTLGGLGDS